MRIRRNTRSPQRRDRHLIDYPATRFTARYMPLCLTRLFNTTFTAVHRNGTHSKDEPASNASMEAIREGSRDGMAGSASNHP